jgi:HIV Tat-specific factor 1
VQVQAVLLLKQFIHCTREKDRFVVCGKDFNMGERNPTLNAQGEDEESSSSSKEDTLPSSAVNPQFYYYQNPTTGTVSNTPLSVAQLVKLLVPVREGMAAILPQHTQCLAVASNMDASEEAETETETEAAAAAAAAAAAFGEWKPISTVDVLKEAACAQWFLTGGQKQSTSIAGEEGGQASKPAQTQGPMTCRSLLEKYNRATDKSKLLVFASGVTDEWISVEKLPHLQQVLQALQPLPASSLPDASSADPTDERDTLQAGPVANPQTVQDELEAFLSSTAAGTGAGSDDDADDEDHAYESDGGTRYVKDPLTGKWIHEALAPARPETNKAVVASKSSLAKPSTTANATTNNSKKAHKKAKFSKRNARHWVYVSGLPPAVDVSEVHKFFGKVGMLDLDPETLQPKMKLYKNSDGTLKGDASLCYARSESVDLALQVLDESPWDEHHTIRVERAKFEAKSSQDDTKGGGKRQRKTISQAQRKVARLALLQAADEGFGGRLAGGRKGLLIVVVKHMLDGIPEADWESTIQSYCQKLEVIVEKITCISKTKVVILKFKEPTAASQAVEAWNGKVNPKNQGTNMVALYWDGVTDYTNSHEEHNPEEEAKRHEDFGKWLDDQGEAELPPELRLQMADD